MKFSLKKNTKSKNTLALLIVVLIIISATPAKVFANTNESIKSVNTVDTISNEDEICGETIVKTVFTAENLMKTEKYKLAPEKDKQDFKLALDKVNKLMLSGLMCGLDGKSVVSPELSQAVQILKKAINTIETSTNKDVQKENFSIEKIDIYALYNNQYSGKSIRFNLVDENNNIVEKLVTDEHGLLVYKASTDKSNKNLTLKIDDERFIITSGSFTIQTNKYGNIVKLNGIQPTNEPEIYINVKDADKKQIDLKNKIKDMYTKIQELRNSSNFNNASKEKQNALIKIHLEINSLLKNNLAKKDEMEQALKNAEVTINRLTEGTNITGENSKDFKIDSIKFLLKDQNGNILKNIKFRIYDKTEFIPNIEEQLASNENGEILFKPTKTNKKYSLELADANYISNLNFTFQVDNHGKIYKINNEVLSESNLPKDTYPIVIKSQNTLLINKNHLIEATKTAANIKNSDEYNKANEKLKISLEESLMNGLILLQNQNVSQTELDEAVRSINKAIEDIKYLQDKITLDKITYIIKDTNGNLVKDVKFRIYDLTGIPNIIFQPKTDNNGVIEFNQLSKNSKYSLELADSRYTSNDKIVINTNAEGKIYLINNKEIIKDMATKPITFTVNNLQHSIKKTNVMMFVKDDEGNKVSGVEFTANIIQPKMQAYQRVFSKNGVINFQLPDGAYPVTVSKRGQFHYNFKPDDIVIEVKDGVAYVVKKGLIREELGLNNNTTFIVTKVKNPVSKEELKQLMDKAKEIIKNADKYDNATIKNLNDIMILAEEEYNNQHTAPMYVQNAINLLKGEMSKLVKNNETSEKPEVKTNETEKSEVKTTNSSEKPDESKKNKETIKNSQEKTVNNNKAILKADKTEETNADKSKETKKVPNTGINAIGSILAGILMLAVGVFIALKKKKTIVIKN